MYHREAGWNDILSPNAIFSMYLTVILTLKDCSYTHFCMFNMFTPVAHKLIPNGPVCVKTLPHSHKISLIKCKFIIYIILERSETQN